MSHIVSIQTEIRDSTALQFACRRLELAPPMPGRHKLYSSEAEGFGVNLRGWTYPVVCQTETGQVQYDNYNGRWGDIARFHELMQRYAVEKAALEARLRGHIVYEQPLSDGAIKLTIQVGDTST